MRVTDEMVEAGLSAARDASDARLPRYAVVRAALEAALSHAAGQEGEQCRAASGEDAYVIEQMGRLLAEIAVIVNGPEPPMTRWSYHDLPEKVRALSRGVPEGNQAAVDSVIRQYCRTCGGCGEIGGHSGQTPESYEEWSAPCPDCSPAAIAAQRKEGE